MSHKFAKYLYIALMLLGLSQGAKAQQLQATLSHYSTEEGLASNAISQIVQDDFGYIWLATWNGLSRFDGYHFYNYQTGAGSKVPNLHNRVLSLTIDSQQNIWMRMYDNRVFVLKRSIDKIINPFENIDGSEEYRTLYTPTVTSTGFVIVNIEDVGLYKLRVERDGISSELITTGGLKVSSMAEGYQNDIWLGTDKGVHRMDLSNLTIERKGLFLEESITCLYSNGYNIYVGTNSGKILSFSYGQDPITLRHGGLMINQIYVDSHGIIWFTDSRIGANRLFPETNNEKHFEQIVTAPDNDGRGGVFSETNGTVWVRMNQGGYGYYNRETDEIEYFHNDPSNPWNLSNTVNAELELNEGVIWESTSRRGLEKLEIQRNTIERIKLYPERGPGLSNEIRTLLYDEQRQLLLIGNKDNSLFFVKSDGTKTALHNDQDGHPIGRTYGVTKNKAGDYLLCSKDYGVFFLHPTESGFATKRFFADKNNPNAMNSNSAYLAVEDEYGNVWVATFGGGVNVLTKNQNGKWVALHKDNVLHNYPHNSHQKVRTVALDVDGNVWAGTSDGILIMSYKDRKVKIKRLAQSEEDPDHVLWSNDVVCLALDATGNMWVGTNGGGLAHTIGRDSKGNWLFENFGSKDGLPSEEIRSITVDKRGNVWFATDHMLCSYDGSKRIFTTFGTLDGVDETMCSEGAAITLPNGNILFGTLEGYYYVDRAKLVTATGNVLKLRITDFMLNDEIQSPRLNKTFDYYVPDSKVVELPDHSSKISLRFASLNYQLQHRVHYQYKLEGYDEDWVNSDKTRTASYKDLPTGTYHFRVKAFLLESPEKYDMRTIEIVVPPYFLLSSNAVWLYMVLLAVGSIWFMFYKQKKIKERERVRELREGPREQMSYEQETDFDFMHKVDEYLDKHYSDPMLMIDEIALFCDLSEEEFVRQMAQITGKKPKEYITDFRIRMSLAKLEETDKTIAQIAYECGFSDPTSYTRLFKQKTNTTPSKYRDDHKKKDDDGVTDDYEIIEDEQTKE